MPGERPSYTPEVHKADPSKKLDRGLDSFEKRHELEVKREFKLEDRGNGRYSIKNDGAIGDWKLDPMDLKYLLPSGKMPKNIAAQLRQEREVI